MGKSDYVDFLENVIIDFPIFSRSLAGPGPRRVMSVRENIINRLRGNSQGNFTVMLNPMGISTNIFQIQFAENFHVRFLKIFQYGVYQMPGYHVAYTDLGANETHVLRGHVLSGELP